MWDFQSEICNLKSAILSKNPIDPTPASQYLAANCHLPRCNLPISAVDAITPAFEHARQQLLRPFRAGQWAKLGLVGLLAGEMGSGGGGGCNPGQLPDASIRIFAASSGSGLPAINPALTASLIAVLIVTGFVLFILFIYVNSVMRFVLFDSVVAKECRIWQSWMPAPGSGTALFCLADSAGPGFDHGFHHSDRDSGRLCFSRGLAQRSQGAHDSADSGRHGLVFCAPAFCCGATAGPRDDQGFCGAANGAGRDQRD